MFQFANRQPGKPNKSLLPGLLIAACLALGAYFAFNPQIKQMMQQSKEDQHHSVTPLAAIDSAGIEQRWGVRLLGIHSTAAGHMLDFRFQVTDADKAAPLLDKKNKPSALIEGKGLELEVPSTPRIGSLRQTSKEIKEGMVFTMLFANPGKMVAMGQKLTVRIGDFAVEHITVGEILNPLPKLKASDENADEKD